MSMPFWQQFAFKICNELGVSTHNVARIDITIIPGQMPRITVIKELWTEGEFRQLPQVFEAAEWKERS